MHEACLDRLRSLMAERDIETLAVARQPNLTYLTGIHDLSGVLVVEQDTVSLVTSKFFRYSVEEIPAARVFADAGAREGMLADAGIEDGVHTDDTSGFESFEMEQTDVVSEARLVKTDMEIRRMREACAIGDRVFQHAVETFEPGMTEWEVAATVDSRFRYEGVYNSFDTLAHCNTLEPHRQPSDREISGRDLLLLDMGCRFRGYCSDMTRMMPTAVQGEREELLDALGKIQQEVLSRVEAGKDIADLASHAEELVEEQGYSVDDHYLHSLGHGVGVEIHEAPQLHADADNKLREGMVVTIEPGLYVPDVGGVRIEDQVVVREDGFERLTGTDRSYER